MAEMERSFQISVRKALIVMAIIAAWCAAYFSYDRFLQTGSEYMRALWVAIIVGLGPMALGVISRRPIVCYVYGVLSAIGCAAVVIWV